jgi:hypothetical protein
MGYQLNQKAFFQNGKNVTMKTISNALQRFRHALNKHYVQRGLSPLNQFGYITSNEWDTFVQQHTTPQATALSNKMKEQNVKNKFRNKLVPVGYKAAMPKWVKKEHCAHQIHLKVALCAPETGSRDILVQMIMSD